MGLTQKILLFTGGLVVALAVTTLAYTTIRADRLARQTIHQGLDETRSVWETFQADRFNKLKLGVRVLGNDSPFKAAVANVEDLEVRQATVLDLLKERGQDIKADFFIATDPTGVVIARSDRPAAQGEDLSQVPVVSKPLEGEESATIWRQGERLFHAVSVPMQFGPDIIGALVAGYAIDEALASDIRKLTHSEMAYLTREPGQPPQLSVSSLGTREAPFKAALGSPSLAGEGAGTSPFELDLAGEPFLAVQVPLKSAAGDTVGSVVALRSLSQETLAFRAFRNSLVVVSLVVMAAGLLIAYLAASRITGPLRRLVSLVERARDGSYAGAVSVASSDEIGVLAKAFNSLLSDLREKEQLIGFLREGMTILKRGVTAPQATMSGGATASTAALPTLSGAAQTLNRLERGSSFAGRYEILGTLGKGGMGAVYRARDKQLDDTVALKVLRSELLQEDRSLLDRFKQEIKLARKITHRNVLRTHDFGESDGVPYISMEYLEGVTLKDLVKSKGALPLGVGLRIAKQMCQGLEAAHQQGVVHRDIKPQNMLIIPESGELKIMDFGIARVSEVKGGVAAAGLTTTGTVMGTPDYMPPEQAQGRPADFRSDVYSLGVVLFEVFTGRLPFEGDSVMSVILHHIQQAPPKPSKLNARLPLELEVIVLRCLEKDPAARYQRVSELLKDLRTVTAREEAAA